MTQIFLGLGSNLGDRQRFIDQAIDFLAGKVEVIARSKTYETAAWGKTNQPKFLNLCLAGQTALSADELLDFIKDVEAESGRKPSEKWGPREIDIDILFYGSENINKPGLAIPHPHMHERAFVLVPLNEIAPSFTHPVLKKSIAELTKNIDKTGVKIYEP